MPDVANFAGHVHEQQGPRECVARLKRIFSRPARSGSNGVGPFSWLDFSDAVDKFFQPASGVSCILGPMDAEIKTRKAPMRREKRKPVGEARTADELVEQETDKQVLSEFQDVHVLLVRISMLCVPPLVSLGLQASPKDDSARSHFLAEGTCV